MGPHRLQLTFTNGSEGTVDLEIGTVTWPNGADLDPDVLYEAARGVPADGGDIGG